MSLLRKITFPLSLVYAVVVFLRNKLYDTGIFTSVQFETPTICVGNLSVGGTGKTPMIEYLIRIFQDKYKIAVLSRGYRRRSKGFILASANTTVEDLGDEPYQIYTKFPEASVAVDVNRQKGILQLEEKVKPDVILLDDAFQHRKVKADLNILLTSYDALYIDDWYLPTGNLRDSKSQVRRADYIMVTKCPHELSSKECMAIKERLVPRKYQRVLFSYLKYKDTLISKEKAIPLQSLSDIKFTLVTGIANPKPLVQYLKDKNLNFDHLVFKDHHFFSSKEIQAFNSRDVILTTEKDYTRLQGKVKNLFYIEIGHAFLEDGEEVLKKSIEEFMKRNS